MAAPVLPDDLKLLIPSPTANMCEAFAKALIAFPTKIWQLVKWMFNSDGTLSTLFKKDANYISAGFITPYAGSSVPTGWLECTGQVVSRATYADLFTAIGVQFGAGDGSTTFQLPDLRDRFPVGTGNLYGFGSTGGAAEITLNTTQIPAHTHNYKVFPDDTGGTGLQAAKQELVDTAGAGALIAATESAGGGQPHNNLPPYLSLKFLIKT